MKIFTLLVLFVISSQSALGFDEECPTHKPEFIKLLKVTGFRSRSRELKESGPYSYEIIHSGYQFKIDGSKGSLKGVFDREAFNRAFMYCSPKIAKCLSQTSKKIDKGSIAFSFKANHGEGYASPSVSLSFPSPMPENVEKCLEKKWSSLELPPVWGESSAKITVEFKKIDK